MADSDLKYLAGAIIAGGISYGFSSLLNAFSKNESNRAHVLRSTPKFKSFGSEFQQFVSGGQPADVLLEGSIEKLDSYQIFSVNTGATGAGRLVKTTQRYKERSNNPHVKQWHDSSTSTENLCLSVPFSLKGRDGSHVRVENVHSADGFRSLLSFAYKDNQPHRGKSLGDFATDLAVEKIHMGSEIVEHMLYFGTSLAGYGKVMLSDSTPAEVIFRPQEVSSSAVELISSHENKAAAFRAFSWIFFAVTGGAVIFVLVPRVIAILSRDSDRDHE